MPDFDSDAVTDGAFPPTVGLVELFARLRPFLVLRVLWAP